ncbi:hypothetical protein [Microbacterium sp. NPDC090014]|uniref:hypothetical protein n=1 Tax=Microbacterium sp. NPDC090014 TaxID=3364205 RepID=UPI0038280D28
MIDRVRVRSSSPAESFDLFVAALGYEERSLHVAKGLSERAVRKVAFSFESRGQFSFDRNENFMKSNGFDIFHLDQMFNENFDTLLSSLVDRPQRVAIDISSFTKFHLAQIVDCLRSHTSNSFSVDFFYAPASSAGWETHGNPIQVAEPIHPAFASWSDDPLWPLTAIIGLGVEENLALGVAEHLDVSAVYAFSPQGEDPEFVRLGADANRAFFLTDYVVRNASYDLLAPFDLFTRLESLVYGLRPEARVAIIPLGPKLFALCALLTSLVTDRATTVWRFSGGAGPARSDVRAAGPVVSLRVDFGLDDSAWSQDV